LPHMTPVAPMPFVIKHPNNSYPRGTYCWKLLSLSDQESFLVMYFWDTAEFLSAVKRCRCAAVVSTPFLDRPFFREDA
jgi:hypothetical protein